MFLGSYIHVNILCAILFCFLRARGGLRRSSTEEAVLRGVRRLETVSLFTGLGWLYVRFCSKP
jgi:hypothetical protein